MSCLDLFGLRTFCALLATAAVVATGACGDNNAAGALDAGVEIDAPPSQWPPAEQNILTAATGPVAVAVDATHVAWLEGDGSVYVTAKTGGAPTRLAVGQSVEAFQIVLAGDQAFWNTSDGLWQAPVSGGAPAAMVLATAGSWIATDGTAVVFSRLDTGHQTIVAHPVAGGANVDLTPVAAGLGVAGVALYAGNAYYITADATGLGSVNRVAMSGGAAAAVLIDHVGAIGDNLAVDAGCIYYDTDAAIMRRANLDGSSSTIVANLTASGGGSFHSVSLAQGTLIFAQRAARPNPIWRVPAGASSATLIADDRAQVGGFATPSAGLAVDGQTLYVAETGTWEYCPGCLASPDLPWVLSPTNPQNVGDRIGRITLP